MELTGKQKRLLRSLGQSLSPAVHVGKAGIALHTVATVAEALGRLELVKVRLPACLSGRPAGSRTDRRAAADQLAEATGSACAGVVGRTVLLYRPNPQLDADRRIHLP